MTISVHLLTTNISTQSCPNKTSLTIQVEWEWKNSDRLYIKFTTDDKPRKGGLSLDKIKKIKTLQVLAGSLKSFCLIEAIFNWNWFLMLDYLIVAHKIVVLYTKWPFCPWFCRCQCVGPQDKISRHVNKLVLSLQIWLNAVETTIKSSLLGIEWRKRKSNQITGDICCV